MSIDGPPDWVEAHAAGSLLAIAERDPDGHFASNISAAISRHGTGYDVATAVAELQAAVAALPDGRLEEPFAARLGDRDFIGSNVAFRDSEAGTLVQVHLFTAVSSGPVVDLVHLVGTCGADRIPDEYTRLQQILQTTVVGVSEAP